MRLEDLVLRYLPDGGAVADIRPTERRGPGMSLSSASGVTLVDSTADAATIVLEADQLPLADESRSAGSVIVLLPDETLVPDMLAWATSSRSQVMEVTQLLSPPAVCVVVTRHQPARVPTVPGSAGLDADDDTWRRLAGELVYERFRNSRLQARVDDAESRARKAEAAHDRVRKRLRRLQRDDPQRDKNSSTGSAPCLGKRMSDRFKR